MVVFLEISLNQLFYQAMETRGAKFKDFKWPCAIKIHPSFAPLSLYTAFTEMDIQIIVEF